MLTNASQTGPSDEDLARRALDDPEIFRELVERHAGRLAAFVANLLGRGADHEDACQDAFLSAYANLAAFDPARGTFTRWIYTIARNRCRDLAARRWRGPAPAGDPRSAPAAGEVAERNELMAHLDEAMEALPFEQRTAFTLIELQGLSYEEAAAIEAVAVGTVKSRVSRAKAKLRGRLEE